MTRQVTSELQTSGSKKSLLLCVEMECSGALPTSSSKKRPFGQGGMLAFFISFFVFSKPEVKKNDDLGDPGVPCLSHFSTQTWPGGSMCPRGGPK